MNKPNYDWDWFTSKSPFLKIMEEECDLDIFKEKEVYYVFGHPSYNNKYHISVNRNKFENNIEKIKTRLLNTNVCKQNEDVKKFVLKCVSGGKRGFSDLIVDGCISNPSGSFSWEFVG